MEQLFDSKAGNYDAWYETPAGRLVDRIEREAIYSFLEPKAGTSLLDIGCGTGNYSLPLAKRGLKVTGVDVSTSMLDVARLKAAQDRLDVKFFQANACCLPFPDNYFDHVISVSALEFVPDLAQALQEAMRVLKPGGRLVVGLIGKDSAWGQYYREKAKQKPNSVFNQAKLYTLEELRLAMPGQRISVRAVLFTPPDFNYDAEAEVLAVEAESIKAGRTDGGFICGVAIK